MGNTDYTVSKGRAKKKFLSVRPTTTRKSLADNIRAMRKSM